MRVTIEFAPGEERRLRAAAHAEGLEPAKLIQRVLHDHLPEAPFPPGVSGRREAAIEMLERWRREDQTDDADELQRAEEELAEFKRNMNANRAVSGERPVFR
jgi:hypothetical protein